MDADVSLWALVSGLNRWALYALMLVGAGSAFFVLITPAPARVVEAAMTLGKHAALAAAACFAAAIGFSGAEIMEGPLLAPDTWAMGAVTSIGSSAAVGVPAMVLLWFGFRRGHMGLLAVGAAGGVAAFLVTGHAATAPPEWLSVPVVALHLAGAAYWIGALYPLSQATFALEPREAAEVVTAFSIRAVWAVSAIFVSGVVISWLQLSSFSALWTTVYGNRLTVKLAVFGMLLVLAAYNKLVLTPRLNAGTEAASGQLRRVIRAEYLLMLLLLGAAASLTLTEPPRAILQGHVRGQP